ncbi:YdcF family protein [Hathewaya massiliensis]|uniref:YdcF family protein n=1 Tax=Hathewaya massiliensis TaxID=1964382 RepID=UPI001157B0D4|nr:YdcF family protein [Hathewaya massiliensis]
MKKFKLKGKNLVLFILGVISIFYFLTLKFFGPIAFSKFWLVLGVILIIFSLLNESKYKEKLKLKENYLSSKGVLKNMILAIIICFLSLFLVLEGIIIYHGEVKSNEPVDMVIVLGAGLKGRELSQSLYKRMITSLEYLKDNPKMNVIVSGGQGPGEDITEAEAMEEFLIKNGIDKGRIIKEDKSRNTFQNFKFSREKLDSMGQEHTKKVLIVTNNFHMFRSKILAKRNGFEGYGLPASLHPYLKPNFYVREFFAVVKSFIFDRN